MRWWVAVMLIAAVGVATWEAPGMDASAPARHAIVEGRRGSSFYEAFYKGSPAKKTAVTLYDPNPKHIWNRLYEVLLIREDASGVPYGLDSLDPLLWLETRHLLEPHSHERAVRVLDEFLQTHAEKLVRDPVRRAMMQRDLWAVFDWSVNDADGGEDNAADESARVELQRRLAEVMRRIALTPQEIEVLPDNYAQAVATGGFAKAYDRANPTQTFLPADLFEAHGPWVSIDGFGEPVAISHVAAFSGRSRFLLFLRLPDGRKATVDYLQTLWNFPDPWMAGENDKGQATARLDLPQFPAGTEVALVRQMTLFDASGDLAPAPITESVQIRVFRMITPERERHFESPDLAQGFARNGQDAFELELSRAQLFAAHGGGLRAIGRDEREFLTFQSQGDDVFEGSRTHRMPRTEEIRRDMMPVFLGCAECHSAGGVNSLESLRKLLKPNPMQVDMSGGNAARWW